MSWIFLFLLLFLIVLVIYIGFAIKKRPKIDTKEYKIEDMNIKEY